MPICYIDQLKELKGKKVFIRVDFNVPQDEKGNITEDTRIAGAVPTIKYAVEQGAKVVLAGMTLPPNYGPRKTSARCSSFRCWCS